MSTRDFAQAFWMTRLLLLSSIPILGLAARAEVSYAKSATDASAVPNGGYVGSEACTECHSDIYEAWRSTRHSYSILTAADAKRADYPLPHKHDGQTPHNRDWPDVAYTIGGCRGTACVRTRQRSMQFFNQLLEVLYYWDRTTI